MLRNTQRELENEQLAHARTQRQLEDTQEELQLSEGARRQLEEAKQQLEDELAETKSELEVMTAERDTVSLNSLSHSLFIPRWKSPTINILVISIFYEVDQFPSRHV